MSDSAYGLTLLVQLALLALVLVAAGVNAWAVRPDLERAASDPGLRAGVLQRFGRMLELVVILLGCAWWLQARGGRIAGRVGSLWPLALVPFAGFIAIASDPEVWPMGTVPPLMASPERRHSCAGRE